MNPFIVIFSEVEYDLVIRRLVDAETPAEAAIKAVNEYNFDEYETPCEDFTAYYIVAVYKEKHDKTDFISEDLFDNVSPLYSDDFDFTSGF